MYNVMDELLKKFYLYVSEPIDLWDQMEEVHDLMGALILNAMPEEPLNNFVYVCHLPTSPEVTTVYLCKAEKNDTVYAFSDADLTKIMPEYFKRYSE